MSRDHLIRLARGVGALLGLLALLVGLPVGLAFLAGWPLPHTLPSLDALRRALEEGWSPDGMVVIKALAVVCWVAWAELAACAVVEVRAALQGSRRAPRVPMAGPLQPFVAHLVAAVLLSISMAGTRSAPTRLPALTSLVPKPSPQARHVSMVAQSIAYQAGPGQSATPIPARPSPAKQVVVRPRDNLWALAERHLGDPFRWREIWERNRDRPQPDRQRLVEPQLIRPGWVLELPPDAVGVEAEPTTSPPVSSPRESSDNGRPPAPELRSAPATLRPGSASPRPAEMPPAGGPLGVSSGPSRDPEPPSAVRRPVPHAVPVSVELPSGSVVGMSFAAGIAAAVAAGRLRRRRRYRPSPPQPGMLFPVSDVGPATRRILRAVGNRRATDESDGGPEGPVEVPFAFAGLDDPQPARIAVGERAGEPVELEITGVRGLTLGGPGGPDVARALMVALLAKGGPQVVQVLVPSATAAQLLTGLTPFPGLSVSDDLEAALREAEVELVRRSRLLDSEEVPDFEAHRVNFPDDPLPAFILVADDAARGGRMGAVASLGARLGVGAVIVGDESHGGARVAVEADGTVADALPDGLARELEGVTLHRLKAHEAIELLGVLAAARINATEPATAPASDGQSIAPADFEELPDPLGGTAIRVQLLGPCRIEVAGEEVKTRLRGTARELLAYFLVHRQGATAEAAAEALWPDAELARGPKRFWTALGNLRSRIREATEGTEKLIDREGDLYRVEAGVFEVDLWRFQGGLAEARCCSDDESVCGALDRAVAEYGGNLLEGSFCEWVEPIRESLRRQALDALVRLSELRAGTGKPEAAIAAVEQAITIDPYAEALYRRGIRLLAELGRADAARRLFRQLEGRLAELDDEPEEETLQLLKEI